MDVWGGIIGVMKFGNKSMLCFLFLYENVIDLFFLVVVFELYVQLIFEMLNVIVNDVNCSEVLMWFVMGVIG